MFPSNLSTIQESAFEGCINLNEISLLSFISSISSRDFYGCKTLIFSGNIETIPSSSFNGNITLTKVITRIGALTLTGEIKAIPDNLFKDCSSIGQIIINAPIKSISKCSSLSQISLPSSI